MYDYGLSILEQYRAECRVFRPYKGSTSVQDEKGLVIIKEFGGTEKTSRAAGTS